MRKPRDLERLVFFHEHVQRSASVVGRPEGECAWGANQKIASRKGVEIGDRRPGAGAGTHAIQAKEIIHTLV